MKIRNTQSRQRRSAFTLMEMMVVVAIIVALAGTGIYYMAEQADKGTQAAVKSKIKSLTDTAVIYKTQHNGEWPQSLEIMLQPDASGNKAYLRQDDIIDPWGRQFTYDPNGANNGGNTPDISCQTPWGLICNWNRNIIKQ